MWLPSKRDIENYFLLSKMLEAQKSEFDLLSKKKSDSQLNKTKIKMVNRVLKPLNDLFQNEDSHKFLDLLDEDDLPTNSDVVLIISQYETAIKEFKDKYYFYDKRRGNGTLRWITKEEPRDH